MKKTVFLAISFFFCFAFSGIAQEMYVGQVYANIQKSIHTYTRDLKLDFYTASEAKDNKKRPLLLVVHGGGFSGGSRDAEQETKFSQTMAAKGYAVASIDYELTRKGKATAFGCDCPAAEKIETFKAASDDILKAVNYLAREDDFNFDTQKIVLVGSSAGAEAVLNTVYMTEHPAFKSPNLRAKEFAAVVSFAGAVVDARYIQKGNATPAFLVHGTADQLVPYATAAHHYCAFGDAGFLPLDGSRTIADDLKALKAPYYLMTAEGGTHDWAGKGYDYADDIARFINSVVIKKEMVQKEENASE